MSWRLPLPRAGKHPACCVWYWLFFSKCLDPLLGVRTHVSIPYGQDVGSSLCSTCLPGYYCDNVTTSLDDLQQNKACAAGLTCKDGGHTNPPNLLLNPCPAGHYCKRGDEVNT